MTTRAVLPRHSQASASRSPDVASPEVADDDRRGADRRRIASVLRPFQTPVRGHAYAAVPAGAGEPEVGTRARLAREPSNPADPLAVAVWVETTDDRPWRIGYLDRGVAARVAPRLDDGLRVDARVDGWVEEPRGRWHRPLVRLVPDGDTRRLAAADERGAGLGQVTAGTRTQTSCPPGESSTLWGRPPGVSRRVVRTP